MISAKGCPKLLLPLCVQILRGIWLLGTELQTNKFLVSMDFWAKIVVAHAWPRIPLVHLSQWITRSWIRWSLFWNFLILFYRHRIVGSKYRTTKHRTPEHRKVKTPKGKKRRKVLILLSDRISYHTAIVSCHTDTSYNTDISYPDIIYFHYDITPSWRYIQSYWYHIVLIYCIVSYHMILISHLLIPYHTMYWSGINLHY